jgi:hypothetical protein
MSPVEEVTQVGTAPSFANTDEALEIARAALGYLAAADATQLGAAAQARCLKAIEQADAIATAARASFLTAFTAGQGYADDAAYSARAWLIHQTHVTSGAAVGHTAWAKRARTHPRVLAALAAGQVSESVGRLICLWTDRLPEHLRDQSDELLVAAAQAGLGTGELAAMAAQMYESARSELPDEDPDAAFKDRSLKLATTFGGAGVIHGDLTPECAEVVGQVLDALGAPAGKEDDRSREERYHDALQEAMRWLCFCIVMFLTSTDVRGTLATGRGRVGRACTAPLPDCQAAKRAGTRAPPLTRAAPAGPHCQPHRSATADARDPSGHRHR